VNPRIREIEDRCGDADPGRPAWPAAALIPRRLLAWWLVLTVGLLLVMAALVPHLAHWSGNYSEPVRAQVIESRLDQGKGWLAPLAARAVFSYRYVHQGRVFSGSAYRVSGGQAEAVRRFLPGAMITVYIDPARPERALVQPGLSRPEAGRILLGLVLLVAASLRLLFISRETES
jgi:hypothetical protein